MAKKMSESLFRATLKSVKFYEGAIADYYGYRLAASNPLPIARLKRRLKEVQKELSESGRELAE
jgi:hypothetical protein